MLSACPAPGEGHLDHLVNMVNRFLHCKVTIFPFVIN